MNFETAVYSPGYSESPHPIPLDTIPIKWLESTHMNQFLILILKDYTYEGVASCSWVD